MATGVATAISGVTLEAADERMISGSLPIVENSNGEVRALQTVVPGTGATTDVVIQAGFANADAVTGHYELRIPAEAARVAPYGEEPVPGVVGGLYTVKATVGGDEVAAQADVSGGDIGLDFTF